MDGLALVILLNNPELVNQLLLPSIVLMALTVLVCVILNVQLRKPKRRKK